MNPETVIALLAANQPPEPSERAIREHATAPYKHPTKRVKEVDKKHRQMVAKSRKINRSRKHK
jgi:hypothetical protein